jgi:ribosomal protein L16/L10AE
MQLAFGRATDRAAIVKRGDIIFFIATSNKQAERVARKLLKDAKLKLPCKTRIISK